MSLFLIFENRRPQATLAWLLAFFFLPVLGGLIYIFFGRDWKAFSGRARLLKQEVEATALPRLSPLFSAQDAEIARVQDEGSSHRKLAMLVRGNSRSILTSRNHVDS
jgi:cardiolipin synthase